MCISDHAMSARDEFLLLNSEFEKIKEKSQNLKLKYMIN